MAPSPIRRGAEALILAVLATWVAPPVASAQHEELQRARALFEATAFEDARAVLNAVPDDAGFQRDDAVDWLVLRARIATALGDESLADRELTRLATLVDEVPLPPDLRSRFDALSGAVSPLTVELRWEDGELEAVTAVDDQVLVHDLRVTALEDGRERSGSGRLAVMAPTECRAEVIGPGGAVLATATGCPAPAGATKPESGAGRRRR